MQETRSDCGSKTMDVAALLVAIVSALAAIGAVVYAPDGPVCCSVRGCGGNRSRAGCAAPACRTHARFRVTREPSNPGSPTPQLDVFLDGPPELGRPDAFRDDPG